MARWIGGALVLGLAACVQPPDAAPPPSPRVVCKGEVCQIERSPPPLGVPVGAPVDPSAGASPDQARLQRFQQLVAAVNGDVPRVETVYPAADPSGRASLPVARVVFQDRAFFDSDADQPRADSQPTLTAIAADIRRDVPDVVVTVLGHTDAVGTAEYNYDLSKRRAVAVMARLVAAGVNPRQLTAVAVGKAQPVASNGSEAGRALNRRVEFLISTSLEANLAVVRERGLNPAFLDEPDRFAPRELEVFGPRTADAPYAALQLLVLPPVMQPLVEDAPPQDVAVARPPPAPLAVPPPETPPQMPAAPPDVPVDMPTPSLPQTPASPPTTEEPPDVRPKLNPLDPPYVRRPLLPPETTP